MSRRPSQSVDGLNRSTSSLSTTTTRSTSWPVSRSPSALKRTQDPRQPRYLKPTASTRNRVQFNAARQKKKPTGGNGGVHSSNSNSSSRSGRVRFYTRPWAEGIASSARFRSRNGANEQGGRGRIARYNRWEAAAAAADSRSRSSLRSGRSGVRTEGEYETEIERLRVALHKETRAKDRLRFELRKALDPGPDPDLDVDGLSDCSSACASPPPPRSFLSIPALTRSQGSRWSRSPYRHPRNEFYASPRSLPQTPRSFGSQGRYLLDPDLGGSRWYAVEGPGDYSYGGGALNGQGQGPRAYKPKVRYYYDDDDEAVLRRLRRRRARLRFEDEGCRKLQVKIGWPWLCFTGGQSRQSRREEFENLKEYNRRLSAQLQQLEEGRTLRRGVEAGLGVEEAIDLPRLEAPAGVAPVSARSTAGGGGEVLVGVPGGGEAGMIMQETGAAPLGPIC